MRGARRAKKRATSGVSTQDQGSLLRTSSNVQFEREVGSVRKIVAAMVAFAALAAPGLAAANHHACPQVTTGGQNVDVSRKDCSPVYVPYPLGGPKSPLPAGANQNVPLPTSRLGSLPPLQTPYPMTRPLPGQNSPPDPLGCYGPDLSFVNKGILVPTLGKPRNSDPADPLLRPFGLRPEGAGSGCVERGCSTSTAAAWCWTRS